MSRVMRDAWLAMMPRKLCCAGVGSSRERGPAASRRSRTATASGVLGLAAGIGDEVGARRASLSCSVKSLKRDQQQGQAPHLASLGRRRWWPRCAARPECARGELNDDRLSRRERLVDRGRQVQVARHVAQGWPGGPSGRAHARARVVMHDVARGIG